MVKTPRPALRHLGRAAVSAPGGLMLNVRICNAEGEVIASGSCSDSGYFPPALSDIYNAGLNLAPARSLEHFGESSASADYPVGARKATFGYTLLRQHGGGRVLDDEVTVHVERI